MRSPLIIFILSLVLVTSGCLRETGNIAINFTDLNITEREAGLELSEEPEIEEPEGVAEPEEPEALEHDPCSGVVCDDSITTCPDGTVMTCENTCEPETGNCTSCIPDCTDHVAPEEECELECGTCEFLDEEDCECVTILKCDGNGICETSEWPEGKDCLPFEACDDSDECTLDVFDFNYQSCTHVDTCCDDGDECTEDSYNYTTHECQHNYTCCSAMDAIIQGAEYDSGTLNLYVNNQGYVDLTFDVILTFENGSVTKPSGTFAAYYDELATFSISEVPDTLTEAAIQSRECEEVQDFIGRQWIIGLGEGEEPGDVVILSIDPIDEIVILEGYGIDMTNWTLEDAASTPHIYTFPDGFVINGTVYLHTIGCTTDNNDTDLYWGKKDDPCRTGTIWTDDGDTATLRNETGGAVSFYEYPT